MLNNLENLEMNSKDQEALEYLCHVLNEEIEVSPDHGTMENPENFVIIDNEGFAQELFLIKYHPKADFFILKLQHLNNLEISHIAVHDFPINLLRHPSLLTLRLLVMSISHFPPFDWINTTLQKIDLRYNKLETLPSEIAQLTRLEHIYLNENMISSLPSSICSMSQLREIDLTDNAMRVVPKDFPCPQKIFIAPSKYSVKPL